MKEVRRILAVVLLGLLTQACLNPNAYQEYEHSYGYSGKFVEEINRANQGYVSFIAGKDIVNNDLRWHCLRRIAELCRERNFDYFRTTKTHTYDTTTKEPVTRYWGTYTDAYGYKYNRYKTHQKTVPALKRHVVFQAFRGAIPTAQTDYPYYPVAGVLEEVRRGKDSRNLDRNLPAEPCMGCGRAAENLRFPEHCAGCGQYLLASAQCPHCFEEAGPWTLGLMECADCSELFRNAYCPHCGGCQTLRDCSPFICAFCENRSETGVESGVVEFKCPHCSVLLGWPEELFGDYECVWCTAVFTVQQCDRCGTSHAINGPMAFTCWGCSHWIAQEQ